MMVILLSGCGGVRVDDPMTALGRTDVGPEVHREAMVQLDAAPGDPAYIKALQGMIYKPGYTQEVREEAFSRLEAQNVEDLKRLLRQYLPRMEMYAWLSALCETIADKGWADLTPALVSSWARPVAGVQDEMKRPEYQALARLVGPDRVTDEVFRLFVESKGAGHSGLRTRCWELLHRLGQRERLAALLQEGPEPEKDAMLSDLRAAARDLGIVPHNREEILWLLELRKPERAAFWAQATKAVAMLPVERRLTAEMRDLPIVVSASVHDPGLLTESDAALYARVESVVKDAPHFTNTGQADDSQRSAQRLYEHREQLRWGDLLAMLMIVRAMEVPQVVSHLFRYAERDRADTTTEYGGVIALDTQGRFEVLEFPPVHRSHDQEFSTSQAMMDAGYTSGFHFHFHVQWERNDEYAGPGLGDVNYANNVRANCIVFTSVGKNTMNVDYYRHGPVVVDMGVIRRDGQGAADKDD